MFTYTNTPNIKKEDFRPGLRSHDGKMGDWGRGRGRDLNPPKNRKEMFQYK